MKVLVCGDRNWDDEHMMWEVFAVVDEESRRRGKDVEIVTGDCRGADEMIRSFATGTKRKVSIYRADWLFHGKAAGPIRNQHMLDEGKPDLVLAFHDNIEESKGTKDMVRRALKAGIPTILFGNDEIRTW